MKRVETSPFRKKGIYWKVMLCICMDVHFQKKEHKNRSLNLTY